MTRRKIPNVLLANEQQAILDQFLPKNFKKKTRGGRPVNSLTMLRNLVLIRLLLNGGLRCSEALALRCRDLEPSTGRLWVRQGKGKKDRGLWLCEADINLILAYIAHQIDNGPDSLIFVNLQGEPLTSRYVRKMVGHVAREAGITKEIHPHTLRHTFATDLLRATKNLRLVQKALGHERITTTQIYTHVVDEELEDAMKNFRNRG